MWSIENYFGGMTSRSPWSEQFLFCRFTVWLACIHGRCWCILQIICIFWNLLYNESHSIDLLCQRTSNCNQAIPDARNQISWGWQLDSCIWLLNKIPVFIWKKCKKWSFHKYYVCLYNKRGLTNNYEAGSSSGIWSYKMQDHIYLWIDGQPLVHLYLIMPFM